MIKTIVQVSMPPGFGLEVVYTACIMLLCFLLYHRTREVYELTKHKGVQFFRLAFVFFGFAYLSRLLFYGILINDFLLFEPFRQPQFVQIMPLFSLLLAYFSTMAILYLIYSTIWRKYSVENFLTIANFISLGIGVLAYLWYSPVIVSLAQLLLLGVLLAMTYRNILTDKTKRKTHLYKIYFLIPVFWMLNLALLPGNWLGLSFGVKIIVEVVSFTIFAVLYYKISKWVS